MIVRSTPGRSRRSAGACAHVPAPATVDVGGLSVHISRKAIKSMRMRVLGPDGRIEVSAPASVSLACIEEFVRARRGWIERKRAEVASSPMAQAQGASPEDVARWRRQMEDAAPPLVARWERIMGVKAGKLAYRNMKSRWGSCQPKTGRICLNVRLALYPPACLEYVVVHELAHLIVHGHGPDFQAVMERCLPDWRVRRAQLR